MLWQWTGDRLSLSEVPYSRGIMTPPGRIRLMKPLILYTQIALNFSNPQQTTMANTNEQFISMNSFGSH